MKTKKRRKKGATEEKEEEKKRIKCKTAMFSPTGNPLTKNKKMKQNKQEKNLIKKEIWIKHLFNITAFFILTNSASIVAFE